ncbi:MAG: EI24 domain-containing protein [Bacteroidales bacterium]|nr:EI24 domain-containing protein [Bacteroidales bacterium]
MNMFLLAISNYRKGFRFLLEQKLSWYFIFPIFVNIIMFYFMIKTSAYVSAEIISYLESTLAGADFWGASFLLKIVTGGLVIVFKILLFLVFAYIGGYLVLILLSPVFSHLSETTEKKLTGNDFPFVFSQFISDVFRGIKLALRNGILEILILLSVWIITIALGWIPIIGQIIAILGQVLLFLVSAYFYGFSFMDYTSERYKLSSKEGIKLIKSNRWAAIGTGFPFALLLVFNFWGIGIILAGFVAIISVVAATFTMLYLLQHKENV